MRLIIITCDPGTNIACQRTLIVHLIVIGRVLAIVIVAQLGAHRQSLLPQSWVGSVTFVLVYQAVVRGNFFLENVVAADGGSLEEICLVDLDAAIDLWVSGIGFAYRPLATLFPVLSSCIIQDLPLGNQLWQAIGLFHRKGLLSIFHKLNLLFMFLL